MAIISAAEMRVIEDALDSAGGYVADFSNTTFAHFFRAELGVDIMSAEFTEIGTSKGRRLRGFLEKVPEQTAHSALMKLADYIRATGYRPHWRSKDDYEAILGRFDKVIARLGKGLQVREMPDEPTIWLARVSRALRALSAAALNAYTVAEEEDDQQVPTGTKQLLEMHLMGLKDLLPEQFPASALNHLTRHIQFSQRVDCRDIAYHDVPDIMAKAEKFAVAISRKHHEGHSERDIANLVHEVFRAKLIATQKADHPDWHALVLQCSVILVERFKSITGLHSDSMDAIGRAFTLKGDPILRVPDELDSDTGKSVQQGAMLLFQGFRQFIRNPHAHGVTKTDEDQAYQYLMLMSLLLDVLVNADKPADHGGL